MKGRAIEYLPEELAWIEARKDWPRKQLASAFQFRFGREDVSQVHLSALCKRMGWKTGRTGCFVPGQAAHNKGKPMRDEVKAKCLQTAFRKGNLPHNTRYLGHERVSKDGYVEISVDQVNPHTGFGRRYVLKHRWLWEQKNGPLPAGTALKCRDGDKTNTDPDNWEAVPRAILPRLAGSKVGINYDQAPAELKPTIMAIAKLDHARREATQRRSKS